MKDKETGGKKKYRYSGISFRNTETLNRVLEGYGFTKENTFAKVTLFITVSRTMEILDGKMEIKNKRCYWCYRTCNGVDIRSSSWRKSIVKGRTIYDMVSAVDALLYKTVTDKSIEYYREVIIIYKKCILTLMHTSMRKLSRNFQKKEGF